MNEKVVLKIENLSKKYRLGLIGTRTISHDLNRFLAKVRGKDDPYLKVGESNSRESKGESDYVWALKDINLEVREGEVLGIIGKNGAGKSTLLKVLSKVTGPSEGTINYNGKIASLLEVGTGFHPEMTGRENIFLNGAILGMTKKEISEKLDEIISFSGCLRYIDTPVKRYSSGMKVRLAFAVAAHLEPDILVVDEVLAVGDAEFQKKAIGKMQDISKNSGRTVLFVSHDMAAVKNLCTRAVVIENGKIAYNSDTLSAIEYYFKNSQNFSTRKKLSEVKRNKEYGGLLRIDDVICNIDNQESNTLGITGSPFYFKFVLNNLTKQEFENISLTASVYNQSGSFLFSTRSDCINKVFDIKANQKEIFTCKIPKLPLNNGMYFININCSVGSALFDLVEEEVWFEVLEGDYYGTGKLPARKRRGVYIEYDWL